MNDRRKIKLELVASSTASISSKYLEYPLTKPIINVRRPHVVKTLHILSIIVKREGMKSLWRGCLRTTLRTFPQKAILFPLNDLIKNYYSEKTKTKPLLWIGNNFIAGGITGVCVDLLFYPLNRSYLARAVLRSKYRSQLDWIIKTWKNDGIRGLYRGIRMSNLVSTFTTNSIYLGGYYSLKRLIYNDKTTALQKLIISAANTSFAYWIVYPIESVRNEFERAEDLRKRELEAPRYDNMRHCAKQLFKRHGFKIFFQGSSRYFHQAFGPMIGIVIYDLFSEKMK